MRVAVCFNRVPPQSARGEAHDRVSEEGAEVQANAVLAALKARRHQATPVPLGDDIAPFVAQLSALAPEVVFNLCEGFWGESRRELHVAALYDLLGLFPTGSPPLALGVTQDKARTKQLLAGNGLPTPPWVLVRPGERYPRTRTLHYPLFVKPRFEDASLGITHESIVTSEKQLLARIRYIHETYRQGALIEEFIDGREFNVALLGNTPPVVLPIQEIRFASGLERPIVSYAGKWFEGSPEYTATEPICPARLGKKDELLVRDVALRAFKLLECRDYARVDIRLKDGVPYILEINANPDISPDAGLARAARVGGHEYPQLVENIAEMALARRELSRA